MERLAREASPEYPEELPNSVEVIEIDNSDVDNSQVLPQLQEFNNISRDIQDIQDIIDRTIVINNHRNENESEDVQHENRQNEELNRGNVLSGEGSDLISVENLMNQIIALGDKTEKESVRKRPRLDDETISADKEDESCCQICMEPWTSAGVHRLCCLSCGHLFGQGCVVRWLKECTVATRRCPTCNVKADLKDVRVLYANKLIAIDNSESNRLRIDNETLSSKNKILELQLSTSELRNKVFNEQVQGLMRKINELENQLKENILLMKEKYNDTSTITDLCYQKNKKFHMEKSIEIDPSNGCRVFDFNKKTGHLAISQKTSSRFSMFAGYGIKLFDVNLMNSVTFIPVHQDAIRDLSFHSSHESLVLSVGFDKTAKLVDVNTKAVVHNFPVGLKAWSCCWAGDDPNNFLVGCEQGKIVYFDIRQTSGAVDTLSNTGIRSPVISLASVPPTSSCGIPRGGFLACTLNSCYAYEQRNNIYTPKQMFSNGSYFCVKYDEKCGHGLISCRGKSTRDSTFSDMQSKHSIFSIERGENDSVACQTVHTFEAGDKQTNITRPCFINVGDDTLIAAYQESTKSIPLRSLSTGKSIYSIPANDSVIDICSFKANDKICMATLTSSHLRLYHYSNY